MPINGTVDPLEPSRNPHDSNTSQRHANTCKWDSTIRRPSEAGAEPRPPEPGTLDRWRGERVDADGQSAGTLRPSGCDHDPFGVSAWASGVGVGGAALGSGGFERGAAPSKPDQEGNGECPPLAGTGTAGTPQGGTGRTDRRVVCVCERARRSHDGGGVSEALDAGGGGIDGGLSGPSPHASAWLRLQAGERRPRYSGDPALSRAQEYSAHRALYRTVGRPVQGVLGGLNYFFVSINIFYPTKQTQIHR